MIHVGSLVYILHTPPTNMEFPCWFLEEAEPLASKTTLPPFSTTVLAADMPLKIGDFDGLRVSG